MGLGPALSSSWGKFKACNTRQASLYVLSRAHSSRLWGDFVYFVGFLFVCFIVLHTLRDLNSQAWDGTCPSSECGVLTTGPPRNSPDFVLNHQWEVDHCAL